MNSIFWDLKKSHLKTKSKTRDGNAERERKGNLKDQLRSMNNWVTGVPEEKRNPKGETRKQRTKEISKPRKKWTFSMSDTVIVARLPQWRKQDVDSQSTSSLCCWKTDTVFSFMVTSCFQPTSSNVPFYNSTLVSFWRACSLLPLILVVWTGLTSLLRSRSGQKMRV